MERLLLRRIILFPLTRLVLALLAVAMAFIGRDAVANGLLSLPNDAAAGRAVVTIIAVSVGYIAYVRLIERRPVRELAAREAPRELAAGVAIGGSMIAVVVGTLWVLGYYRVEGVGAWGILLTASVTTAATAVWEELVFRGMIFRILEEGAGTWIALALSAGAFGLLHLGNEGISILGVLTTVAVAGVFLAGVYVLTRRLWVAIGAHFAVNLAQGPVFGLSVSGGEKPGLLQSALQGPELLTGGAYGVEASLIMLAAGGGIAIYVLRRSYVRGKVIKPMWSKDRSTAHGGILPELR